ncbi:MAG TPA: T9SS type A sorting domain-containing protein [bacterium]|nr:T9SS type A sorting domain-containing protein [bacterium]
MLLGTAPLGSRGDADIVLAVWQPDSTQIWSEILTVGGAGNDAITSVAALPLPSGVTRLEVGGTFQSAMLAFGPNILTTFGSNVSPLFMATWGEQPTGLGQESRSLRLELAPNPAHHTIRITGAPAGPITVLDALGREVRTATLPSSPSDLDLTGLPPGLYLVRAGTQARRLMVE